MKQSIVICGGGGKTTLYKEYPELFLDIDHFVWHNTSMQIRNELITHLSNNDIESLSKLYENIMKTNNKLRNDKRIILVHHPINSIWLERETLMILRPSYFLHRENIKDREKHLQELSINDWNQLGKYQPMEYSNFDIFHNYIFSQLKNNYLII